MSLYRLLPVARDMLREQLHGVIDSEHIRVMPNGRPLPHCGSKFLAIHATAWRPASDAADLNRGIAEIFDFDCTLTFRTPDVPPEHLTDELYLNFSNGMEATCRIIMLTLHQSVELLTRADLLEYPRWAGNTLPTPVGPEWFYSSPDLGEGFEYTESGLTMTVSFGDARRVQTYEDME